MWYLRLWTLVLIVFSHSISSAQTKKLFEGYYKISSGPTHVGYFIQRYELDTKRKEFISTYFLRTSEAHGNNTESLKAYATEKLTPIKYQYTSLQGAQSKTIDANLRKNKKDEELLQVRINENGKPRVFEQKIQRGTFLSTFLIYLLLQGEKGVQTGVKYQFTAIAEEDGKPYPGDVYIASEEKIAGQNTYKILYNFKRAQFVNFINDKGDALRTVSPALDLTAELVPTKELAIQNMNFNEKSLALLFGNVPDGKTHRLNPTTDPASTVGPTSPNTQSPKQPKDP